MEIRFAGNVVLGWLSLCHMFIQIVAYYFKIIGNSNYEYDITIDLFYLLLDKIPSACSKGDLIRKIFISEFPMY